MPNAESTYAERLEWEEGVRVFGESVLRTAAGGAKGVGNWKARGIPSHQLVRLLREQQELPAAPTLPRGWLNPPPEVPEAMVPELNAAWTDLTKVLLSLPTDDPSRVALMASLKAAVSVADARAARRGTRRRPSASVGNGGDRPPGGAP